MSDYLSIIKLERVILGFIYIFFVKWEATSVTETAMEADTEAETTKVEATDVVRTHILTPSAAKKDIMATLTTTESTSTVAAGTTGITDSGPVPGLRRGETRRSCELSSRSKR